LGKFFNREKIADSLIRAIKDSLNFYQSDDTAFAAPAILVLGRSENNTRNISISSTGAFINELWEFCGGRNAFADLGSSFATLNREDLIKRNPQLVVEFKSNKNQTLEMEEANKKEWHDLNIAAVKNDQIYVITGNEFLIPGPRMYMLAKKYHNILKRYKMSKKGENQDTL
jgi:ABC-type Fe3+-hydroxamate transport system substrate-binding protein